jgi:fumarate reductase iron-sulfur subunit
MPIDTIRAKILRFDPKQDQKPEFQEYHVPFTTGMSAMDILDYIYQNMDGGLAYYDHAACALGVCAKCVCKINGKLGLLCQTIVTGDIVLEVVAQGTVIRDLVVEDKN